MNIARSRSYSSILGLTILAGAALALPGCPSIGYVNYPPIPGDTISHSVNNPPVPQVLTAALGYIVRRYPPIANAKIGEESDAPFAINLPETMEQTVVQRIVGDCSPYANALTASTKDLPTYHVARIEIRGGTAKIDIVRPVMTLPDKPVSPLYQGINIELRGLSRAWEVTNVRQYPVGSPDMPPLTIVPEEWQPVRTPAK